MKALCEPSYNKHDFHEISYLFLIQTSFKLILSQNTLEYTVRIIIIILNLVVPQMSPFFLMLKTPMAFTNSDAAAHPSIYSVHNYSYILVVVLIKS